MPLVSQVTRMIHVDKVIGDVHRVFCAFGLGIDVDKLPDSSRLKDPAPRAGRTWSPSQGWRVLPGGSPRRPPPPLLPLPHLRPPPPLLIPSLPPQQAPIVPNSSLDMGRPDWVRASLGARLGPIFFQKNRASARPKA